MLFTVSAGDAITRLPHQGYIVRTQPETGLQALRFAQFMTTRGAKKVFSLAAQTPYAVDMYSVFTSELQRHGVQPLGQIIYDATKTSFRSEIDQAMRAGPDTLLLMSYAPDVTVLLRDLYRAGYEGGKYTPALAANATVLSALPHEVVEGLCTLAPSPDIDSPAYKKVREIVGTDPDPYSCQIYDHVSLALLSIAKSGIATGAGIHDDVRAVGNPAGVVVNSAVDGLKALGAGKEVNYEGASGPCKFTPIGNIESCKFRYEIAEQGHYRLLGVY